MDFHALGEDLLQQHVLSHVSFVTMARLQCTCTLMRNIGRRIARQPYVRTHMLKGYTSEPPAETSLLTVGELTHVLGRAQVSTAEVEREAGSDENLRCALGDCLERARGELGADDAPSGRGSSLRGALRDVAQARALLARLAMPARPDICLVFASKAMAGVAEVLATLLPTSCVVFGAVSNRGVIGSHGACVSEVDSDAQPLIAATLIHLAGTRIYPFFEPRTDPHTRARVPCADVTDAVARARERAARGAPAESATLLVLADGADGLMRGAGLIEQLHGKGIPALGGLVERDPAGTLLLRAPHRAELRAGLRRGDGSIGLLLEGCHVAVPAVTRGATPISPHEWDVVEAESSSRAVCPGHNASQHVVKTLAGPRQPDCEGNGGSAPRRTTPLQALHELAAQHGGSLPSPLYLALRPNSTDARRRLVHPVQVLHHTGALAVESEVGVGELCGFASVNAQGSSDELALCARAARGRLTGAGPTLCVSFVCCGRGVGFHQAADKETLPLRSEFPDATCVGFFAAGELGPRPFGEAGSDREDEPALMGFTAVHALLRFNAQ